MKSAPRKERERRESNLTRVPPSSQSGNNRDDDLQELETILYDSQHEDVNVFVPTAECMLFELALWIARERTSAESRKGPAEVQKSICHKVLNLHSSGDGLAGIQRDLTGYLRQCEQLLELEKTEVEQTPLDKVPPERRPALDLAKRLIRLERFLECLQHPVFRDLEDNSDCPDVMAFVRTALSYGIGIGYAAAQVKYYRPLARDAKAQAGRARGGAHTGVGASDTQIVKRLFSRVLNMKYKDGLPWKSAIIRASAELKKAGDLKGDSEKGVSKKRRTGYSTSNVRRFVDQEKQRLIEDIRHELSNHSRDLMAACAAVAEVRNSNGFILEAEWLERLYDETPDPLAKILDNKLTRKQGEYFAKIAREIGSADIITDALQSNSDGE